MWVCSSVDLEIWPANLFTSGTHSTHSPYVPQVGISFEDVRMAVLCQRIVPAQVGG